jgi:hypothetical protein
MDKEQAIRLLHFIDYRSPWEILEGAIYRVRGDNVSGLLLEFAIRFNRNDISWHNRHLTNGTTPLRIWRRPKAR